MGELTPEVMARSIIRAVERKGSCDQLRPAVEGDHIIVRYRVDEDRAGFAQGYDDGFAIGLPFTFRKKVVTSIIQQIQGTELQ